MAGQGIKRTDVEPAHFIRVFETQGATGCAREFGLSESNVYKWRRLIEHEIGTSIKAPTDKIDGRKHHPARYSLDIINGTVLVGSDAHIWPGYWSTAMRAFIRFAKDLKPKAVILNGDVLDFPRISRHPTIGWEQAPEVAQELEAAQEQLQAIQDAAPNAKRVFPIGNHDIRFETRIANDIPEFRKVKGVHLKDHFPYWHPCWSCWINDEVVVKHRFKGGINAVRNNTLYSGKTILTGHLHSMKVTPFSDYNGHRWGVDTGTLADPYGEPFVHYTEDNPVDWRAGFIVLTFHKSRLLWPEIVHVVEDGVVDFRGALIKV